jgi:hypothetical protein
MDPFEFLWRAGFPVIANPDGTYDAWDIGKGMSEAEVSDLWLRLKAWPNLVPASMLLPGAVPPASDDDSASPLSTDPPA